MNTFLSRANAIFAFTLSAMAALTFACFLTTAFSAHQSDVDVRISDAIVKNVPDFTSTRKRTDLGFVSVDLKVDVTHLFNWNVKQLFLYLTAEYETTSHKINQVVLWDKIILRGENMVLRYTDLNPKYYFWDYGNGLKNNENITMTLSWNVIPNAGILPKIMGHGSHQFAFPNEYSTRKY